MIEQSESISSIMPAYIEARKSIHPAGKSTFNSFDKYKYANEQDWHDAIMPALLANDLVVVFSCDSIEQAEQREAASGKAQYSVTVKGSAKLIHSSGEWLKVQGAGEGQDRSDKGIYKAQTGLKKYLYSLLFALPTTDDPEKDSGNDSGKQKSNQQSSSSSSLPDDRRQTFDKSVWDRFNKRIESYTVGEDNAAWRSFQEIREYLASIHFKGKGGSFDSLKTLPKETMRELLDQLEQETEVRIADIQTDIPI